MVLSFTLNLKAQSKFSFGLYGGAAIPTATYHHHDRDEFGFEFKDTHKTGLDVATSLKFASVDPLIFTAIGLNTMAFDGKKTKLNDSTFVEGKGLNYTTLSIGIHIGKEVGPYLLPALSASLVEEHSRFGYNAGVGYVKSLGLYHLKLDFNITYSFLNVLGKEKDELKHNVLRILLGIVY